MNEQAIIWANTLGLLPVNFLHDQNIGVEKYAMLNGYTNNFCLSFNHDIDTRTARNSAWSANMANYVSVDNDNLLFPNDFYKKKKKKSEPKIIEGKQVISINDIITSHSRR